ncbi:ATP phosphoribosyltransferase regulatory subunit [Pararhodospirillum photometricum]|uniref:ATP phosphoribosyltransferase regulatory subunit n=1 Tax=Pararhodospirillum photometricum DSM 122 TaxID=1150469 RepID=H6SKI2_PARPM|nr:ATP phosphoribosyltransferase regulatory subunit [Pararhodospirillum photometricum]CCG08497.1 ATP phosphoribosyltransferase regulatory subunit [Pararhodospirillum photometricum DSM 122]
MTVLPLPAAHALLPNGLRDLLPPDAQDEAQTAQRLVATFLANGYQRVKPPLIEFEESLLSGAGRTAAAQTFRVMDPITQRMMGLRSDMTTQVARIAGTRLAGAPRPLRLAYVGQVLRVRGSQLRPERQFTQAGFELIGAADEAAVAEVLLLAVEALDQAEVTSVAIDLICPPLVPALTRALGLSDAEAAEVRDLLEQKDLVAVSQTVGAEKARLLVDLAACVGPAERSLAPLAALALPPEAAALRDSLVRLVRQVQEALPTHDLTLDPLEHHGFEYQTGSAFALFARGARGELGRGGAYHSVLADRDEACCGATLYLDAVLDVARRAPVPPRVLVENDLPREARRALQAEGFVTVPTLAGPASPEEARRLHCTHFLGPDGRPVPLAP